MKKDFPIFKNNKNLIYLDNAATTQKPKVVIDAMKEYYETTNANAHRGIYNLSAKSTYMLGDARNTVAKFINGQEEEIIFTKSATEGLNMLALALEPDTGRWNNVIVSDHEHHSNFIPWQQLCKRTRAKFVVSELKDIFNKIDSKTAIVAITGMSNVTGEIPDLKQICSEIKQINPNIIIIVDATQLIAHKKIDVQKLGADFVVFSAHKIYGPLGVGVVWGKLKKLETMRPFLYGGNMVFEVNETDSTWASTPPKFEAGTIDVAGIIGFSAAINYLEQQEYKKLFAIEEELKEHALKELRKISEVKIFGHDKGDFGPVISFHVIDVHPHDLAEICNRENICIRAGHHCAQPLMKKLDMVATGRISLSFYNTKKEIDKFVKTITKARKVVNG